MKNKKYPEVSILILNYNGIELLKIILKSIEKIKDVKYEVVVVDNNSTDASAEFLKKRKGVKTVLNKKNIGYPGINFGVPFCKGDFVLFLNNDMELTKDCISRMLRVVKSDKNIGMVAPKLVNYYNRKLVEGEGTWVSRSFYSGYIKQAPKKIVEIPYVGAGLVRMETTKKIGYLFDPLYFLFSEDLDLGLRLRLAGYKTVFVPDAIIYHMHAATVDKVAPKKKHVFFAERNSMITFFKVLSLQSIILYFPYMILMRILAILKDLIKFKFGNAGARILAIFWLISHPITITKKRRAVQKTRKVLDRELFKVFSESYLFRFVRKTI